MHEEVVEIEISSLKQQVAAFLFSSFFKAVD